MRPRPSRRNFLRALGALSVTGLAGCSARTPRQSLEVRIFNNSERRHILLLSVVDDERVVFQQDIDLPAKRPNHVPTIDTLASLGKISDGKQVEVQATLDGTQASKTSVPLTLDCTSEDEGTESKRISNAVTVRVQEDTSVIISDESGGNHCFAGTLKAYNGSGWLGNETKS